MRNGLWRAETITVWGENVFFSALLRTTGALLRWQASGRGDWLLFWGISLLDEFWLLIRFMSTDRSLPIHSGRPPRHHGDAATVSHNVGVEEEAPHQHSSSSHDHVNQRRRGLSSSSDLGRPALFSGTPRFYEGGVAELPPPAAHYLHLGVWYTKSCDYFVHRHPLSVVTSDAAGPIHRQRPNSRVRSEEVSSTAVVEGAGHSVVWLHNALPNDRFVFVVLGVAEERPSRGVSWITRFKTLLYGKAPAWVSSCALGDPPSAEQLASPPQKPRLLYRRSAAAPHHHHAKSKHSSHHTTASHTVTPRRDKSEVPLAGSSDDLAACVPRGLSRSVSLESNATASDLSVSHSQDLMEDDDDWTDEGRRRDGAAILRQRLRGIGADVAALERVGAEVVEVCHADITALDYAPGLTGTRMAIESKRIRTQWFPDVASVCEHYRVPVWSVLPSSEGDDDGDSLDWFPTSSGMSKLDASVAGKERSANSRGGSQCSSTLTSPNSGCSSRRWPTTTTVQNVPFSRDGVAVASGAAAKSPAVEACAADGTSPLRRHPSGPMPPPSGVTAVEAVTPSSSLSMIVSRPSIGMPALAPMSKTARKKAKGARRKAAAVGASAAQPSVESDRRSQHVDQVVTGVGPVSLKNVERPPNLPEPPSPSITLLSWLSGSQWSAPLWRVVTRAVPPSSAASAGRALEASTPRPANPDKQPAPRPHNVFSSSGTTGDDNVTCDSHARSLTMSFRPSRLQRRAHRRESFVTGAKARLEEDRGRYERNLLHPTVPITHTETMLIVYTQDPNFNAVLRAVLVPGFDQQSASWKGSHQSGASQQHGQQSTVAASSTTTPSAVPVELAAGASHLRVPNPPFCSSAETQQRLLSLYEAGIPSWCIFLPRVGLPYRRVYRTTVVTILNCWPVIALVMGLYDLYKHIPFITEWMGVNFAQWMETHVSLRLTFVIAYAFTSSMTALESIVRILKSAINVLSIFAVPLQPFWILLQGLYQLLSYGLLSLVAVLRLLVNMVAMSPLSALASAFSPIITVFKTLLWPLIVLFRTMASFWSSGAAPMASLATSASSGASGGGMLSGTVTLWTVVIRPIKNLFKAYYDGIMWIGVWIARREVSLRTWYLAWLARMYRATIGRFRARQATKPAPRAASQVVAPPLTPTIASTIVGTAPQLMSAVVTAVATAGSTVTAAAAAAVSAGRSPIVTNAGAPGDGTSPPHPLSISGPASPRRSSAFASVVALVSHSRASWIWLLVIAGIVACAGVVLQAIVPLAGSTGASR